MKYKKFNLLIVAFAIITLAGCKKEEIPFFNGGDSVNFWLHTYGFSLFGATTVELPQDTIILDMALSGRISPKDRFVTAKAVEDAPGTPEDKRLTTATPDQYEILGGVIPANESIGKFKVLIKNPESLAADGSELRLKIKTIENQDFKLGLTENIFINLKWSREILQPATWNAMRYFFCATYSTEVYKIFMEVTGLKQFYYFQGLVTQEEGFVMGKNFGDRVRELSAQQGSPLLHDDGPKAGLPIIPIH